ncbi:MAG: ABC transporter [Thaumarchaeota archaeon]|nr:MAG: ABC transporter [Nitrososphaerota archaeon]
MTIIKISNFSFIPPWSEEPILKNINLEIEQGEMIVILGDAKSGNRYLIQALNGIVPRETGGKVKGEIIVDGLDVSKTPIEKISEHLVVLLPDPAVQVVAPTVESDVAFGPANLGLSTEEIQERTKYALRVARLEGFEKRNPRTLSGGECQSLVIAGLIAMKPKIIAMIDPVAMLDPIGKERIYQVIRSLNKEYGMTVIVSESGMNVEPLFEIASRVIVMHKGEIITEGAPEEIVKNELARKLGIPQISELFLRIREYDPSLPVPVKLEDAVKYIKERYKDKRLTIEKAKRQKIWMIKDKCRRKPIIHIKNLHHIYPGHPPVHALNGVSLDIYPGEFVGIIGQNGSGKTTLALHLVGILKPTNPDCEILVDGVDPREVSTREIIRHINYVFQNPSRQFFSLTVKDELAFGLKNLGYPQEEIEKLSRESLRYFGVEEYYDWYVPHLPRDVITYVAEAAIAAMNPKILIVDEPTGGLDTEGALKMMESLVRLNKAGKTIIIITHDMKVIAQYVTRVIVIHQGKIFLDGTPREVFSKRDLLKSIWLKPPQITEFCQELRDMGFPDDVLSIDEAYNLFREFLRG